MEALVPALTQLMVELRSVASASLKKLNPGEDEKSTLSHQAVLEKWLHDLEKTDPNFHRYLLLSLIKKRISPLFNAEVISKPKLSNLLSIQTKLQAEVKTALKYLLPEKTKKNATLSCWKTLVDTSHALDALPGGQGGWSAVEPFEGDGVITWDTLPDFHKLQPSIRRLRKLVIKMKGIDINTNVWQSYINDVNQIFSILDAFSPSDLLSSICWVEFLQVLQLLIIIGISEEPVISKPNLGISMDNNNNNDPRNSQCQNNIQSSLESEKYISNKKLRSSARKFIWSLFKESLTTSPTQSAELYLCVIGSVRDFYSNPANIKPFIMNKCDGHFLSGKMVRVFKLLLEMAKLLPLQWDFFPDRLFDNIQMQTFTLLRDIVPNSFNPSNNENTESWIYPSDYMSYIDPNAEWFSHWCGGARQRSQMFSYFGDPVVGSGLLQHIVYVLATASSAIPSISTSTNGISNNTNNTNNNEDIYCTFLEIKCMRITSAISLLTSCISFIESQNLFPVYLLQREVVSQDTKSTIHRKKCHENYLDVQYLTPKDLISWSRVETFNDTNTNGRTRVFSNIHAIPKYTTKAELNKNDTKKERTEFCKGIAIQIEDVLQYFISIIAHNVTSNENNQDILNLNKILYNAIFRIIKTLGQKSLGDFDKSITKQNKQNRIIVSNLITKLLSLLPKSVHSIVSHTKTQKVKKEIDSIVKISQALHCIPIPLGDLTVSYSELYIFITSVLSSVVQNNFFYGFDIISSACLKLLYSIHPLLRSFDVCTQPEVQLLFDQCLSVCIQLLKNDIPYTTLKDNVRQYIWTKAAGVSLLQLSFTFTGVNTLFDLCNRSGKADKLCRFLIDEIVTTGEERIHEIEDDSHFIVQQLSMNKTFAAAIGSSIFVNLALKNIIELSKNGKLTDSLYEILHCGNILREPYLIIVSTLCTPHASITPSIMHQVEYIVKSFVIGDRYKNSKISNDSNSSDFFPYFMEEVSVLGLRLLSLFIQDIRVALLLERKFDLLKYLQRGIKESSNIIDGRLELLHNIFHRLSSICFTSPLENVHISCRPIENASNLMHSLIRHSTMNNLISIECIDAIIHATVSITIGHPLSEILHFEQNQATFRTIFDSFEGFDCVSSSILLLILDKFPLKPAGKNVCDIVDGQRSDSNTILHLKLFDKLIRKEIPKLLLFSIQNGISLSQFAMLWWKQKFFNVINYRTMVLLLFLELLYGDKSIVFFTVSLLKHWSPELLCHGYKVSMKRKTPLSILLRCPKEMGEIDIRNIFLETLALLGKEDAQI